MKKLDIYSQEEIEILKKYYSALVYKQPIANPPLNSLIRNFKTEKYGDKFRLVCVGNDSAAIVPIEDISTVAARLDLKSPKEVLAENNANGGIDTDV